MARVKEQLAFQVEQVKREAEMKVSQRSPGSFPAMGLCCPHRALPSLGTTVAVHSLGARGRAGCCVGPRSGEELPWLLTRVLLNTCFIPCCPNLPFLPRKCRNAD